MKTLLPILFLVCRIHAQSTAQELASATLDRWASGKGERARGLSSVVRSDSTHAVLLISGTPLTGNSGDDTILGMEFSGVYEASLTAGNWTLGRQIPFDDLGQILSH